MLNVTSIPTMEERRAAAYFETEYTGEFYVVTDIYPDKAYGDLLYYPKHDFVEPYKDEELDNEGMFIRFFPMRRTTDDELGRDILIEKSPESYVLGDSMLERVLARVRDTQNSCTIPSDYDIGITDRELDFSSNNLPTSYTLDFKAYTNGNSTDKVEHPSHYTNGKFETIEIIEDITSGYTDGFIAHCVGTAVKYVSRSPFKHDNPKMDIEKAITYLKFAVEHIEKESNA